MLQDYDKKNNPFKVPANYFENFNQELMAKIESESLDVNMTTTAKRIPLRKKISMWGTAVAAVLILAFVFVNISENRLEEKNPNTITGDVVDDYYSFLESELSDIYLDDVYYDEFN